MRNIKLIAFNTLRSLLSMKSLYLMGVLVVFILVGNSLTFFDIVEQGADLDPEALQSRQVSLVNNIIGPWMQIAVFFGLIFGSAVVYWETKHKTVVGILAKPVSRAQFLLGKMFGIYLLFGGFMAAGVALGGGLMAYFGLEFTVLFATGVVINFGAALVYTTIAFALSLFVHPMLGGGVTFLLWSFGSLFGVMMNAENLVVKWAGYALYYLIPSQTSDNVLEWGLQNNMIDPEMGLYWSIVGENILYAGVVLFLGILLYRRRDIVMG